MEINNALTGLVESLSEQILASVSAKIESDLQTAITNSIAAANIEARIDAAAQAAARIAAAQYEPNLSAIDAQLTASTSAIINNITATADTLIAETIAAKIRNINFEDVAQTALAKIVENKLTDFVFPEASIDSAAIAFSKPLSGDNISGGIIREFASTGIDDKSTKIQVTVLDTHTVVENQLLTNELVVKTTTKLEGEIQLNGEVAVTSPGFITMVNTAKDKVKEELDDNFFNQYSDKVFDRIRTDGIDLSRVTLDGAEIIVNNELAKGIVSSNLKRVGVLNDLQVQGEALIHNTVFVTKGRIGINTMEPSNALTLWDDEIEILIGKKQRGIAQIGSGRDQSILLTTNSKNNLMLNQDGSVTVTQLNIGAVHLTSSQTPPNYDAPKATVVFNANPSLGGPLGWVSLGSARWANFGIIE